MSEPALPQKSDDLAHRLMQRATIRRCIKTRKSVQEGKPDKLADLLEEAAREIDRLTRFIERAKKLSAQDNAEIEQILGKVLGYPWYKDDQKNFPGATEADGVCVGEHLPVTLAVEAAKEIERLRKLVSVLSDADTESTSDIGLVDNPYVLTNDTEAWRELSDGLEEVVLKEGTYIWIRRWTKEEVAYARRKAKELGELLKACIKADAEQEQVNPQENQ